MAAKTTAALPGSAAAADSAGGQGTGTVANAGGMEVQPNIPFLAPEDVNPVAIPTIGRIVHYIAPNRTPRVAFVVGVLPFQQEYATEKNPIALNLFILADGLGDAQLWRESNIVRLPGEATASAAGIMWSDDPEKTHCWRWPVIV